MISISNHVYRLFLSCDIRLPLLNVLQRIFVKKLYTCNTFCYKFSLPIRFKNNKNSIFSQFEVIANEHHPINLGMDCPDYSPPSQIVEALTNASRTKEWGFHQYARNMGQIRLVNILARFYSKLIKKDLNPLTEIIVTAGAYEALYAAIVGNVETNDEVILIEPFYNCYEPMIRYAGGIPKYLPLHATKTVGTVHANNYVFDFTTLTQLFNKKTKMIIINTPSSPMGKVFKERELSRIGSLCEKWDVLCVCDEVFEWQVFKPNQHLRMATLPGMWNRTITIGSGGKMFGTTGWKIGWAYGPKHLIRNLECVHQLCNRSCATTHQEAFAICLENEFDLLGTPQSFLSTQSKALERKRDLLAGNLRCLGMPSIIPGGGYFLMTNFSSYGEADKSETDEYKDVRFAKWLAKNVKVLGIPTTAFYSDAHKHLAENFIRFNYAKDDESLIYALDKLTAWKSDSKLSTAK